MSDHEGNQQITDVMGDTHVFNGHRLPEQGWAGLIYTPIIAPSYGLARRKASISMLDTLVSGSMHPQYIHAAGETNAAPR